jgi:hypothetical protein
MAIAASFCFLHSLTAQTSKGGAPIQVQTFFNFGDSTPVRHPVKLPRNALNALGKDERVASCLEESGLSPQDLPANWFVASEVHLDGPGESDFVVLPGLLDAPNGEISQNVCLFGANTAQMWVLRKVQNQYLLVLSEIALDLEILHTRTNGLLDIQVGAVVGVAYADSITYKFDGSTYRIAARNSRMTGIEPLDLLSGFQSREFTQFANESSESVRAHARAWLWSQWKAQRLSYLNLKTYDNNGEETASYYINRDSDGEWQIVIKIHRVLRPTASEGSITEDELIAADKVERTESTADDSQSTRAIPDGENISESHYKLQFLDNNGILIAKL